MKIVTFIFLEYEVIICYIFNSKNKMKYKPANLENEITAHNKIIKLSRFMFIHSFIVLLYPFKGRGQIHVVIFNSFKNEIVSLKE